jgi:hypothetical protein
MSELDEFLDELHDRIDEIEGSRLIVGPGAADIWLHTGRQVRTWLEDARDAWAQGKYKTDAEADQ